MPDAPVPDTAPARTPGLAAPASADDGTQDAFRALVAGASRDQASRSYFAAILAAQGLSLEETETIWRSFLAAADEGKPKAQSPLEP